MIYKYFSAANTPIGFINYFGDAMNYENATQILYIKGGSGVGKSTLMHKVSAKAQSLCYDVTHIHCSSDKDSLDGVIVNKLGIALFDATMPHIADPTYPRINGKIIDLGVFLDESRLKPHKDEVIALVKDKKYHYNNMYSLLGALDGIGKAIHGTIEYDDVALAKLIKDIECNLSSNGIDRRGYLSLVDSTGYINNTDGIVDGRKFYSIISGIRYVATDIVDGISRRHMPYSHEKYYSILEPTKIETMATDSEIVSSAHNVKGDIIYNVDNMVNIKNRHAYNILIDMEDEILGMASGEIALSQEAHKNIEKIYKDAMDFDALDSYQDTLVKSLF